MTSQDKFIALTRKGEDTRIEYKTCTEEISESLYESVCSLLNHSGGQILVGVQNDGTIIGVNPRLKKCPRQNPKMSQRQEKCPRQNPKMSQS